MKKEMAQKESAQQRRKTIINMAGRNRRRFIAAALGLLLLVAGGFVLLSPQEGETSPAAAGASEVSYPVKDFQNGKARFYDYKTPDGITVKYFILKSSDGVIRAAFDACDVCWPEGKGYSQKDDFMVCRNCGKRFASIRINDVTGGCNPAALTRSMVGENVVIKVKDIVEGRKYFDFKKRG